MHRQGRRMFNNHPELFLKQILKVGRGRQWDGSPTSLFLLFEGATQVVLNGMVYMSQVS